MSKITALLSLFLVNGCTLLQEYQSSPVEQFVEDEIQKETGVKIEFTGSTSEPVSVSYKIPI